MKNYKSIFGILAGAVLVALVSSCDLNKLPVFDDDDAFAAFESTSYSVNEDAGSITIPVTVASVAGISTTVTYSTEDGTAVYGTNYELADTGGVLYFDSEHRTQYITIYITDINDDNFEQLGYDSSFTGALTFNINLESATAVNLGYESTCTVTIRDMNHPLADLIGDYQLAGESGRYGDTTWDASLYADEDNLSILWIHGIDPYMTGYADDVYLTVSDDHKTLSLSIPAWAGYSSGYYVCYIFLSADGYYYPDTSGTIDFVYDEDSGSFISDEDWGFMVAGYSEPTFSEDYMMVYFEYVWPPITLTKVE